MISTFTCEAFFDGEVLHGPRILDVDASGHVVRIDEHKGNCDFALISPGFVDLQMNGFGAVDVATSTMPEFLTLDEELARCGTTSWLGTIVTAPLQSMTQTLKRLDENIAHHTQRGCIGVHMEGPFLGAAPGAHRTRDIIPVDSEFLQSLPESVRLVTIAPEQMGAPAGISSLTARGIVVSLGHSRCTTAEFEEAQRMGAQMVTHLYNGMSEVHHRADSVALMALTNDEVVVGVIADLVHVRAEAIDLAFRAKPSGTVCLVSDSVAWMSPWAVKNGVEIRDGSPRLPNGTLAGSSTPLAEGVRNCVIGAGVPLDEALRAATSTPARLIGRSDIGHIRHGEKCDFVGLDGELSVVTTVRRLPSVRG
ncbi:unannotated protein [freshwater metagenome]|uniref:Unannotated protein n=1 Tax=freshwater metagenome TaxID=449393 RepID=A0A6J6GNN3_9ZZZZ|nr:amidohydrolase family protein [Actinomycetota bacterium]